MPEPQTFEDLEVQFTHGDPLYIPGLLVGRDTVKTIRGMLLIQYHEEPTTTQVMRVDLSKVNCWRVTRRIVEPEVKVPGE